MGFSLGPNETEADLRPILACAAVSEVGQEPANLGKPRDFSVWIVNLESLNRFIGGGSRFRTRDSVPHYFPEKGAGCLSDCSGQLRIV